MTAIAEFEALISDYVEPWVKTSDCFEQGPGAAEIVLKAYKAQKEFLTKAVAMKKPSEEKIGEMLADTSAQLEAMVEYHDKNSRSDTSKHTQTLSEGLQVLVWVTVDKTPVPFANETISSCMFYGNKVMMDQKGKDEKQVQWVKDFKGILEETSKYIKAHHTTGVAWGSTSGEAAPEEDTSAPTGGNSVQAYDDFLKTVPAFVKASEAISAELGAAAASLEDAFATQRAFLALVEEHSKPSDEEFMGALQPQIAAMEAVGAVVKMIKDRDLDQHGKAIEEGAQLVAWVSVPTTVPHVAEGRDQVVFYHQKILMKNKGDEAHKEWVATYKALLDALHDYVKAEHKTGLAWKAGAPALKATAVPKAESKSTANVVKASGGGEQSELAKALSVGTDISKGLKKVSDAEKTHKNRTGEAKPIDLDELEKKKAANAAAAKRRDQFPTGEAKTALEGLKWVVEYHVGSRMEQKQLEIEVDKSHSVYIYGCQNTFIKIIGKVNAITVDKCKKTQVMFESCIGSVELTSCTGCEMQVQGTLPSCSIDKSNEVMLYLSRDSMGVSINTSACTCINVTVPGKTDDEDPIEMNIPEQFISHIKGNKIQTTPMEHSG
eukprot:TRINITY_DN2441_c0_g1_i1.p1 TRINITY_DN2441_c0_g1~~TRINITY_DN2441_c0_g1_i1.p1  ORF type:complete len:605 (+),score=255.18 TRINITY_DN2441_c0_g1_i1:47-1861(+)